MSVQGTEISKQPSKQEKIFAKLPTKEILWVKSTSQNGEIFYTTSNPERTQYYLYKKVENGFLRIAKDTTPANFNQLVDQPEESKITKKPKAKT